MCNKEIYRHPWPLEEVTFSPRLLLVQSGNQKALRSAKNNWYDGKKNYSLNAHSLILSSTYYAFGCREFKCKNPYMRNWLGVTISHMERRKILTFQRKTSSSMTLNLFTVAGVFFWTRLSCLTRRGLTVPRSTFQDVL